MKRVLVVDDERKMRRLLQMMLEHLGLESVASDSGEEALALVQAEHFDLVLTDLRLPGMSGLDLLRALREADAGIPVIVLTAYGTVQSAVDAMKLGAFDYVMKPFDVEAVEQMVRNALRLQQVQAENRYLREQLERVESADDVVGPSPAMRAVIDLARQVAATPTTVLITGETGSGKEVVAQMIHAASPRHARLFVPVNCAAIPADLLESELFGHVRGAFTGAHAAREGKFEVADGGTLFLDEIGDMPIALQAKLLRVLQDSMVERVGSNKRIRVDVRVISSTNQDLEAAVAAGRFRQDLYYRLNVFHIAVPALRARKEDVRPLAEFFLARYAREFGRGSLSLAPEVFPMLESYRWPGNVRELQNVMERAAVLTSAGGMVDARLLGQLLPTVTSDAPGPSEPAADGKLAPAMEAFERKFILRTLRAVDDNKAEAARVLGVSERTLWYKLKKHGL
ncbi:MAG TPA: sigma-54 dependent transcriptional regulator [Candidatus Limnocylindria bacterium]|nr:sigma-54 dependent transcriptional regulator [Candidatus Limnocylindria bacterium]